MKKKYKHVTEHRSLWDFPAGFREISQNFFDKSKYWSAFGKIVADFVNDSAYDSVLCDFVCDSHFEVGG